MRRRRRKSILRSGVARRYARQTLLAIALLLIAGSVLRLSSDERRARSTVGAATGVVERVIDGDTLLLTDGRRVRLMGIDAPESVHPDLPEQPFGESAAARLRALCEGLPVRLEFDRERIDRYSRVLAYVYCEGALLNEAMVVEGLARFDKRFPISPVNANQLKAAEESARTRSLGIWSASPAEVTPTR
ncbi:thermonuclease family protein [Stratiformator vulcanicus]|uniref:Thermonuclease n=1 Tax=Stratiformator vulcanicus TaxID=2527980 RepID=A0A517R2D4_9PLAN|nr:thermonuclease family protein [Stratiformator vulcanicus]QDT38045.1 Thermonuclease precursor [Stratiformator vulcanicus]